MCGCVVLCRSQGGSPQYYLQQQLGDVYNTIIQQAMYLGIWGNSNFTDPSQWIKVGRMLAGW